MLRPSGSIVLPFEIKKASLALRIESLLEKKYSTQNLVTVRCIGLGGF